MSTASSLRNRRSFIWLPVALLLASAAAGAIEEGDPAPPFVVEDLDGRTYDLSEMGETVILLFFFSPGDPYCVTAAPQLETDIWRSFGWHDFKVLGINIGPQSASEVQAFRDATRVTFPLVAAGAEVGQAYEAAVHSYVLIDARDVVSYVSSRSGPGAYDAEELREAVSGALEGVAPPKESTWGRIKTLFEEKV